MVSIKANSETIDRILAKVLEESGLTYKLNDRQIIVSRKTDISQLKKGITINGTILDKIGRAHV